MPWAAPVRGFSISEFERRTARAQAVMDAAGLDALLVSTPHNVRYFSGLDMQFWESPTRPWFIVVPRQGAPIAVMPEIGAPAVATTWIDDLRTWPAPQPDDDGVSLLASVLTSLPRRHGRIGAELGREMALRMPVLDFMTLRDRTRPVEIVDGTTALWHLRMVKSEAEICHLAHICDLASATYEALPSFVAVGDSERDVARKVRIDHAQRGADGTPFLPVISGQDGIPQIIVGPTDRRIKDGDILFLDTGATYDGYFCDFDRNYAVGRVSDAARRAHDAVWRATEAGIKATVPGATTDQVFAAMARVLDDAGSVGNNVGRLGHGLGLQLTEPPSHRPGDGTAIVTGMVLTIEPGMEFAPGKMIVHEENVVVTPDGAVLLTRRAPRELPVVA
jgi:Xaa-Pro dipeptidase